MEELLQQLFEADVLSEETKTSIQSAFANQLNEAIELAKAEAEADVKATLTEQWITERDTLIEALDTKVGEYLENEMAELKEDIERFRDLEAEYADKLVEAKSEMADELKQDISQLIENIDAFLEIRLKSELQELKEDIQTQKQNLFGRRIFEAFAQEYINNYADEDSAYDSLREAEERLENVSEQLSTTENKYRKLERTVKMQEVLSPLSGRQREVMEAILKNVETSQLEEGYSTFIGRVIRETDETQSTGRKVIAENASVETKNINKEALKEAIKNGVVKNGDSEVTKTNINEGKTTSTFNKDELRKLAGINI
jgi:hypothetical protein